VLKGIQLSGVECELNQKYGEEMMYTKPEVTKLASSIEAIQSGTNKPQAAPVDGMHIQTLNAYEADE
jgi:hypothetical protein